MSNNVQIVPWKPGCCEAMNSGVAFVRLASLTSPLNSKSFFTISRWPICAAMNKGVASSSICEFGTAPKAKSTSATFWWPFWQAIYNGVASVFNARSTWAWWSDFTAKRHPPWLAKNKAVAPPPSLAVQADQVEKNRLHKAEMACAARNGDYLERIGTEPKNNKQDKNSWTSWTYYLNMSQLIWWTVIVSHRILPYGDNTKAKSVQYVL